jgi:heterodisulfide reductase subunit A
MKGDVVVIGAGTAGIETSGQLAKNGCTVTLLEKDAQTGGHLRNWYHLFPDRKPGNDVIGYLDRNLHQDGLKLEKGTSVENIEKNGKRFILTTDKGSKFIADAIVVATGFDLFKSEKNEEYGYGIYDNVITSADLEKKFREGSLLTASGKKPSKIGFVHCVGSRDEKSGNLYCSKLCCVTAVKQAIEVKEMLPDSKVFCFYMDIRMGGAHYEELYMQAQLEHSVNFIRGKVSEISENIEGALIVKVEDTLIGRPLRMELDILVLMAGMEASEDGKKIGGLLGLKTGENRFFSCSDDHFGSNISNVPGVFYSGSCTAPMNITETITSARSAALDVLDYLKDTLE